MEKVLSDKIIYYENPAFDIAKKLKEMGYEIADRNGYRLEGPRRDFIGILKEIGPVEKKGLFHYLLGKEYDKEYKAFYIGGLWLEGTVRFKDELREANPDSEWFLEIYGRKNIREAIDIVRKIKPREVRVAAELKTESNIVVTYFK